MVVDDAYLAEFQKAGKALSMDEVRHIHRELTVTDLGDQAPGDRSVAGVAALYEEHRQAAFPRRLIGADANGVEMVSLDAGVAGCVTAWLSNEGRIDDGRWDVLADCEQKLNRAIPALDGYERSYYQRLLDLTLLILGNAEETYPAAEDPGGNSAE